MCYAIPAKVVEIKKDKNIAVIDYFGETRHVLLDLTDVHVGDYIYAQGGISVRKIPEQEALEILETWKEIFFELKKTDEALSQLDEDKVPKNVLGILQKVNLRKSLKPEELVALFSLQEPNELSVLYEIANNVRQREHGNASCVHGIIEFSNYCQCHCQYCGIRCERKIPRYRMSPEEIIETAKYAIDHDGFKAFVLQSGEDPWYDDDTLYHIVKTIRGMGTLVFLSLGMRSLKSYQKLYEAGARAVLMRFETSNPKIFSSLRPNTTLEERLNLIQDLQKTGYILATGFLIGLPSETLQDRVNNILLTKQLAPDMYSFGPFLPTTDTPLADLTPPTQEEVLKTIAIARLQDASCNILVTTAMETLDKAMLKEALMAGGNSMMINVTPSHYKKLYSIYDNRAGMKDEVALSVQNTVNLLYSLGRAPTDLDIQKRK